MILNLDRPFQVIGAININPDFVYQDGIIFAWSESHCQYEHAWWLDEDAETTPLCLHLRETRPLPDANTHTKEARIVKK